MNACVALAKDWRTDKYLRRLEVSYLSNHRQSGMRSRFVVAARVLTRSARCR